MVGLPVGEQSLKICLLVSVQYTNVVTSAKADEGYAIKSVCLLFVLSVCLCAGLLQK